ncbi:DNA polymerase A [Rhodospirillum rubrum F11]|uniref:DNA polymerase I n=5 Tax=Rhodospirillum rubrum TaxID=1085 RepID=Q2RNI7_RHORT|nr:DNA polymerase I [Rhodospirillum rubrum]ABC24308.1 DNA polymerase A [Rhodospirillum rubrum ATCC 11170]AEO50059.1 DNA polymerase A [Rhodospirillum rubrum F11]MBK5956027.1 DNA polymerase I [Rhodospirillum rubrum]QXG80235.1 DNA polymerase I [Rhodospirillum rubrum]
MTEPKHLYLVDGSGYIFRAYHSLPPMTRTDGTPVNAVYGFTAMLMKLLADMDADHLAVIFDKARVSFRNEIYPLYKAQRPPPPEDLIPQFPLIREAVRAFNVPCIERDGFEADDLIATYAKRARAEGAIVTVVSSDKDLMQLVGEGVALFDPMKNRAIGPAEVFEKFGVAPDKVIDVQALAGDAVDNVPGVPGIGVKTAAQLIGEYGDLETLLARAAEIKQPKRRQSLLDHAEAARISLQLVRLRDDVEVSETLADFATAEPDAEVLAGFLAENGFRSLLARVTAVAHAKAGTTPQPAAAPADDDYVLVNTLAELGVWIAKARAAGLVAIDTETDSLKARRATLVGVSLAITPGRACYIPFAHGLRKAEGLDFDGAAPPVANIEDKAAALALLGDLLRDPGVLKVGHNLKFDLHVLANAGLSDVAPVDDTMVLSYVLDGTLHGHGMDELAGLHLGRRTITFEEVCGKGKGQITFDQVPLDKAVAYAAEDADVTLRLYLLLRDRLLKEHMVRVHETLDRPMVRILTDMEAAGVRVDALRLKALSGDFAKRMGDLEDQIHALAGHAFNVASPKQLGEVLFEEMSLTGGKKSRKTGAWSTDAQVLDQLAAEGHDLPARVLDWRQYAKLKGTYTDALVAEIDERTGRVHTTYGLTVTATGRLSSNDPNLQNIPVRSEAGRKIREAFIAAPGHLLISADYSQIELRLVAHVAGITALRQAFAEGKDIHAITASQVFGVPVEGMDPMVRRQAKAINFGIIYGISAHGLAQQLGVGRPEAAAFITAYFARFPEIRSYMETVKEEARTVGWVATPFGRRIPIPGIQDKNPAARAFAERQAINAPIQGGAADIIKRAMIALPPALEQAGLATRMLLQVHDELIFEAPEAEAETAAALVKRVMETAVTLTDDQGERTVPLEVDTGIAASWAEAH